MNLFFREAELADDRAQARSLMAVNLGKTGGKDAMAAYNTLMRDHDGWQR